MYPEADLLARARALAAEGAWEPLRAAVLAHVDGAGAGEGPFELSILRAEAEYWLGDAPAARQVLDDLIPKLERRGEQALLRRAVNFLGAVHLELGGIIEARAAFERALELASVHGDHLLVARATNNLGLIANIGGRHEAALSCYQLAVPAYQQLGHALGLAQTMHNIAITYRDVRRFKEADEHERRAIEFAREAGSSRVLAMARVGRAELSLLQGEPRVAEAGARLAATEYAGMPDPIGEADALRLLGQALGAAGETAQALEILDRAVVMARGHESALIEAESLRARAAIRAASDRVSAREDGGAALSIYERLGAAHDAAALREWLQTLPE